MTNVLLATLHKTIPFFVVSSTYNIVVIIVELNLLLLLQIAQLSLEAASHLDLLRGLLLLLLLLESCELRLRFAMWISIRLATDSVVLVNA